MNMALELLVATVMVLLTVGIHGLGLLSLGRMVAAADARARGACASTPCRDAAPG